MPANSDSDRQNLPAFDPQFQTEDIAFRPAEMVDCDGCSRPNPPNRLKCLYCGRDLDVQIENNAAIKTNRRKLESWERGFNIILQERAENDTSAKDVATLLSMEADHVKTILDAGCPLPLARVESAKEAEVILQRLSQIGLTSLVVADQELAPEKPLVRLGRIDHLDGRLQLTDFNTRSSTEIPVEDLVLIVAGTINEAKVDTVEMKQRKGDPKLVDETLIAADESILDIYTRNSPVGFRVRMAGFDFSCLGEKMALLATENMRSLIGFLRERASNARFVDNYAAVRPALGLVWEVESHKRAKGVKRGGIGRIEVASETTTSNLDQFTKYSRLQSHLL